MEKLLSETHTARSRVAKSGLPGFGEKLCDNRSGRLPSATRTSPEQAFVGLPTQACLGFLAVLLAAGLSASEAKSAEQRCGWYENPTPGNLWLTDKDASWTIRSQGQALGPNAEDDDKAPEFNSREFVETSAPGTGYGYGCACLTVETNIAEKRIIRVISGKSLPLARCRNDKSLPKP